MTDETDDRISKGLADIAAAMEEDDGMRRAFKIHSAKYLAMTRREVMSQGDTVDQMNLALQGGDDALYQSEFWAIVQKENGVYALDTIHQTGYPEDDYPAFLTEKIRHLDPDVRIEDVGEINEYTGIIGYAREPFRKADRYPVLTTEEARRKYGEFLNSDAETDAPKNQEAKDKLADDIRLAGDRIGKKKPPKPKM